MFRVAMIALALSAAPAWADRNPCLDYLEQRNASIELAMSAIVVQTNLLLQSELSGADENAKSVMVEAANDIAESVKKHTEAMQGIMETTICR